MKVIKYCKVQLLQLSQPSSAISDRKLIEALLFEGYSKDKPKINLGTGQGVELFTAPDLLETKIIRDHFIDGVRYIPVYEDDDEGEIDGDREEQTKAPSREAMIEYIKQAIEEGYSLCIPELIENPGLLTFFHSEALDYEYRMCWNWCKNYHVADVNKARSSSFEDVVKPVIKWLNENANPHASVTVDCNSAQLLTGEIGIQTEEFIKD
ncbi:TPA: hypothetical protein ACPUHW_003841 [Klebsiella pneumoniae]